MRYEHDALRAAAELSAKHINDRQLAGQGDRRDRRGRCELAAAGRRPIVRNVSPSKWFENIVRKMARISAQSVSSSDRNVCESRPRSQASYIRSGRSDRCAGSVHQNVTLRAERRREAGRVVPVRRADGCRQDRGDPAACHVDGRRTRYASTCLSTWSGTQFRA